MSFVTLLFSFQERSVEFILYQLYVVDFTLLFDGSGPESTSIFRFLELVYVMKQLCLCIFDSTLWSSKLSRAWHIIKFLRS